MQQARWLELLAQRARRVGPWVVALSGALAALGCLFIPVADLPLRLALREIYLASALAWPLFVFLAPLAWRASRAGQLVPLYMAALRLLLGSALLAPLVSFIAMRAAFGNLDYYGDHVLGLVCLVLLVGLIAGRFMASGDALRELAERTTLKAEALDRALRPFEPEQLAATLRALGMRAEAAPKEVEADLLNLADGYRAWLERTRWMEGSIQKLSSLEASERSFHALLQRIPKRLSRRWVILATVSLLLLLQLALWLGGVGKGFDPGAFIALEAALLFNLLWLFGVTPLPWQMGQGRVGSFPGWLLGLLLVPLATLLRSAVTGGLTRQLPTPQAFLSAVLMEGVVGFWLARREALHDHVKAAEQKNAEAYARLLQAQLEPHALMNAMNDLAELLQEDPRRAAQGLRDLADFHGQLQRLAGRSQITLGEEREFLERYLAVSAIRLEGLLTVDWDWDPRLDAIPAPPLLLQPLVENALKHGIASQETGGILRLVGLWGSDQVEVRIENTGQPNGAHQRSTGVGLANLRARLAFAYHGEARFEVKEGSVWTVAYLQLPKRLA